MERTRERSDALLWMEAIQTLVVLGCGLFLLSWGIYAFHFQLNGVAGLIAGFLAVLVAPPFIVVGTVYLVATWRLAHRELPSRKLLIGLDGLEILTALGLFYRGFSLLLPIWIVFCGIEIYFLISEEARFYWSSGSSDSSASSTSG